MSFLKRNKIMYSVLLSGIETTLCLSVCYFSMNSRLWIFQRISFFGHSQNLSQAVNVKSWSAVARLVTSLSTSEPDTQAHAQSTFTRLDSCRAWQLTQTFGRNQFSFSFWTIHFEHILQNTFKHTRKQSEKGRTELLPDSSVFWKSQQKRNR